MKRVKVDFSTTRHGGMIRASQKRATETLRKGDQVEAYDPAEALTFVGQVDHLSDDGQFAFLHMRWTDKAIPEIHSGSTPFVEVSELEHGVDVQGGQAAPPTVTVRDEEPNTGAMHSPPFALQDKPAHVSK